VTKHLEGGLVRFGRVSHNPPLLLKFLGSLADGWNLQSESAYRHPRR
jgi:hypothetical protein